MLKAFESVLVFERIHFECVSSGIWVFVSMKVYECFQLDIFVTFVVCHSVRSKGVYYNDSGSRLHRDNLNKCEHKYAPNIKGNVNCPLTYCASVSVSYALEIVEILLDLSVECHIISIIWLDFRCGSNAFHPCSCHKDDSHSSQWNREIYSKYIFIKWQFGGM